MLWMAVIAVNVIVVRSGYMNRRGCVVGEVLAITL